MRWELARGVCLLAGFFFSALFRADPRAPRSRTDRRPRRRPPMTPRGCPASSRPAERLAGDAADAAALGVVEPPAFWSGSERLVGASPAAEIRRSPERAVVAALRR
jgi:hypothetical protein